MSDEISLYDGAAWFLVFLFSVTLHEAAHAFAAWKMGDDTAHRGGQVTLDPTPHVLREPFGMVLVPIVTYMMSGWMMGWASAPYDPRWANRYPKRAGLMALAGPVSNLCLVILAGIFIRFGMMAHFFEAPESIDFNAVVIATQPGVAHFLATFASITFSLNLIMFLFNLFPVPPLDGSAIPLFFLSGRAAEKYADFVNTPGLGMIGLFLAWKVFGFFYWPLQGIAIRLLYPEFSFN